MCFIAWGVVAALKTQIMNLYRKIDREKIQFDFLVHTQDACFFDSEIISLGGNIYRAPYYRITNELEYRKYLKTFFDSTERFQ